MSRQVFGLLSLLVLAAPSSASIITFDNLPGPTSVPFPSPYTEAGFVVTSTEGNWFQGLRFGNPSPSIFSDSATAAVEIIKVGGGMFSFLQVDLADAFSIDFDGPYYLFEGYLDGNLVFSHPGGPLPFGFSTIANPSAPAPINRLRITMIRGDTTDYNLDNVTLGPVIVPEPTTLIIFGGLLAIGGMRACRRTK